MYESLYNRVTRHGVTLDKCLQPALDVTSHQVGLAAGDEDSYYVRRTRDVRIPLGHGFDWNWNFSLLPAFRCSGNYLTKLFKIFTIWIQRNSTHLQMLIRRRFKNFKTIIKFSKAVCCKQYIFCSLLEESSMQALWRHVASRPRVTCAVFVSFRPFAVQNVVRWPEFLQKSSRNLNLIRKNLDSTSRLRRQPKPTNRCWMKYKQLNICGIFNIFGFNAFVWKLGVDTSKPRDELSLASASSRDWPDGRAVWSVYSLHDVICLLCDVICLLCLGWTTTERLSLS